MRITVLGAALIAVAIIGAIARIHFLGARANRGRQQTGSEMVLRDQTAELASNLQVPGDPCGEGQFE